MGTARGNGARERREAVHYGISLRGTITTIVELVSFAADERRDMLELESG